jgi:hypothetical protein
LRRTPVQVSNFLIMWRLLRAHLPWRAVPGKSKCTLAMT